MKWSMPKGVIQTYVVILGFFGGKDLFFYNKEQISYYSVMFTVTHKLV